MPDRMTAPATRYTAVGECDVAYQIVGNGPFDLLWGYGLGSHVDLLWEVPWQAKVFSFLATVSRLILFDRRGTGASGRLGVDAVLTWEELTEDMVAVLDAAGSTETAILATLETGPMAILFAAMHPERVSRLLLLTTTARYLQADDYPIGVPPAAAEELLALLATTWGTEELSRLADPRQDDPESHRQGALVLRASATPREAVAQYRYFMHNVDVRHVLPLVRVPTLVVHAAHSSLVPASHGRYLAEHIDGARFVEVPIADATPDEEMLGEIVEFLTGDRPTAEIDRILTTVLFTDIVRSTELAASLGDQRWRELLDSHDSIVRAQLRRFRGSEIKTTGDGFLVSFDGPARAIRCARAIADGVRTLGIDVRAGLHTGECEVRGDDLSGLAVHIAARIGSFAGAGDVVVSGTVKDLVIGSGIAFVDRGEHELRGVPGTWKLFSVES
jgi:class 3 adenylate cyclase